MVDAFNQRTVEEQLDNQEKWAKYTGADVFNSSTDAYTKGSSTISNTADCRAGYFLQHSVSAGEGGCTACFPGTHSTVLYKDDEGGSDRSADKHKCSGACPEGYTSPFGSKSGASCIPKFKIMTGAQDSRRRSRRFLDDSSDPDPNNAFSQRSRWRTCEGALDTTGNRWKNRGFTYVTSREECEEAARLLNTIDVYAVAVTQIEDRCADVNLLTGSSDTNTTFICENVKELQGGACYDSTFTNNNGIQPVSVDCRGTCSDCGNNEQFCRNNRGIDGLAERFPMAAPVGYCVLEHFEAVPGPGQRLAFYDECSAAFYDGSNFSPICKVLECPLDEQIRDNGASSVAAGLRALETDNAECESNDIMKALLQERDSQKYKSVYYVIAGLGAVCYITLLLLWWINGRDKSSCTMTKTWWRDFKTMSYVWFKLADVTSDWGFWGIEVRDNLVFESEMVLSELDIDMFRWFSLGFTLLGTLLIGADIFALYKRYTHSQVKDAYKADVKHTALPTVELPPIKEAHFTTWLFPLLIGVFEDIPQITLSIYFMQIMGASDFRDADSTSFLAVLSDTDPLAVFSLVLSSVGLAMNIIYGFKLPSLFTCCWNVSTRCYRSFTSTKYKKVFYHGVISEAEAKARLDEVLGTQDGPFLPCIIWTDAQDGHFSVTLGLYPDRLEVMQKKNLHGPYHTFKVETLNEKESQNTKMTPHGTETVKMLMKCKNSAAGGYESVHDLTETQKFKSMHIFEYITMLLKEISFEYKTTVTLVPDPGVTFNPKNGSVRSTKRHTRRWSQKAATQLDFIGLKSDTDDAMHATSFAIVPLKLSGDNGLMGAASTDNGRMLLFSSRGRVDGESVSDDADETSARRSSLTLNGLVPGGESSSDGMARAINKMTVRSKGGARRASLKSLGISRFKAAAEQVMTFRQLEAKSGLTTWDHVLQQHVGIGSLYDNNEDLGIDLNMFGTTLGPDDAGFENVIKAVRKTAKQTSKAGKKPARAAGTPETYSGPTLKVTVDARDSVFGGEAAIEFESAIHALQTDNSGNDDYIDINETSAQQHENPAAFDAFFSGESVIAAEEEESMMVDAAFFEGNAAIEAAELDGALHENRITKARTIATSAGGIQKSGGTEATAKPEGMSPLKKKIGSFYSHKLVPVALEVIRQELRPRWDNVHKRWALLSDVPADCHIDLQREARLDEEV